MRERSPPLTKIMHPSHPVWAIAGFNKAKCNAESPPGGTACLITVSSVPGKLSFVLGSALIYPTEHRLVVVFSNCSVNIIKRQRLHRKSSVDLWSHLAHLNSRFDLHTKTKRSLSMPVGHTSVSIPCRAYL